MTTTELLRFQIDQAGKQVNAVFSGLSDGDLDHRTHDQALTPRQMLGHLTECYVATQKKAGGQEHEWGSFQPAGTDASSLLAELQTERAKAAEAALGAGELAGELATDFMILHDAYHVGQMCTVRLSLDPNWNAYSIYGM